MGPKGQLNKIILDQKKMRTWVKNTYEVEYTPSRPPSLFPQVYSPSSLSLYSFCFISITQTPVKFFFLLLSFKYGNL